MSEIYTPHKSTVLNENYEDVEIYNVEEEYSITLKDAKECLNKLKMLSSRINNVNNLRVCDEISSKIQRLN